jgi:hypothetical protein
MQLSLPLFISLSLSLTSEQGVHTLFTGQREREREGVKEWKRGRERESEKEGEREVEYVFQLSRIVIFIYKRNDGCLVTF